MRNVLLAVIVVSAFACGPSGLDNPQGTIAPIVPQPGIDPGQRGSTIPPPPSCAHCQAGQTCDSAGRCYCDANTCSGCCHRDGTCRMTGNDNIACGNRGAPCVECFGTSCREGRCESCISNCAGKQCGSDDCGGSCGICPAATFCNAANQCECIPNCLGKCAGASDGCGGTCQTSNCRGCCQGVQCVRGMDYEACGSEGKNCRLCRSDEVCAYGTCIPAYYLNQSPPVSAWPSTTIVTTTCVGYYDYPGQAYYCGDEFAFCNGQTYACEVCPPGLLNCDGWGPCDTYAMPGDPYSTCGGY